MRIEQVRIEHVPHLDNSTVPKVAAGVTTQFHPRIRIKPTRQAGGKDLGVKAATTRIRRGASTATAWAQMPSPRPRAPIPSGLVAFTAFELLVSLLQAYVFTLLTGVYIGAAISHEH